MSIVSSSAISKSIIDALELKQRYIKRIEITLDVNEAAFCTVEFYLDELQVDALANALTLVRKSYALAELNNDNDT